jgi:hypothetical protein
VEIIIQSGPTGRDKMNRALFKNWLSILTTYLFLQAAGKKKGQKKSKQKVSNKGSSINIVKPKPKARSKSKTPGKKVKVQKRRVTRAKPVTTKKIPLKKLKFGKEPDQKQQVKPKVKPEEAEIPDELRWIQEDPHELLLSRFIETPKGTRLGESIGIDKKMLIMKKKSKFYSIPLKAIKEKGDVLILKKRVDWKKASKLGETWRKRTLDVIPGKQSRQSKVIKIE